MTSVSRNGNKPMLAVRAFLVVLQITINCQNMSSKLKIPTAQEIEAIAKQETSFPKMCYLNDSFEGHCRVKFVQGANWAVQQITDENEFTESSIEEYVLKLMQKEPIKFIQYALLAIGREVHSTNADEFTFSQVSDLAPNERFKIEVVGKISVVS